MKKIIILGRVLSILFILSLFGTVNINAVMLDDGYDDETLEFDDNTIQDVDINEMVNGKLRVAARSAIALDGNTKQILFEQNSFEPIPMASTTKILTALVAIKQCDLNTEFTVSKNATSIRGSKVGYGAGQKVILHELLYGLMFRSGNDAAITIAEGIAGTVENFSKVMNDYAISLGLTNSHFQTPHGLDAQGHYTSAYDLALLTSICMNDNTFREICGEKSITKEKYNFQREYQNINKILWKIPEANGVKTGFTGQAGKCLVSSVRHNDRDIIIVVLNCGDRWNQTEKIYKYVETTYTFKEQNTKSIAIEKLEIEDIIQNADFEYGFKEEQQLEVEVFTPINDIKVGDTVLKFSIRDAGDLILKKAIKSGVNISAEEFNKLILIK